MANPRVKIIIGAEDQASDELRSVGGKFSDLKTITDGLMGSFAVGAAIGAAKLAFELGELGAQANATESAFQNVSGGSRQARINLDAMRAATRGTVVDTELMQRATGLMQMGLADSSQEIEKLTNVAVTLGTAMGRSATASMEEFALLLANQSIPRLDTFGISAGKVRTRINELLETVPGMTRETAFMTATMEEADIAMARLGEVANDDAVAFEQLTTTFGNMRTEAGQNLAPAIASVARGLNTLLNTGKLIQEVEDRTDALTLSYAEQSNSVEELVAKLKANGVAYNQLVRQNKIIEDQFGNVSIAIKDTAGNIVNLNERTFEIFSASASVDEFSKAAGGLLDTTTTLTQGTGSLVDVSDDYVVRLDGMIVRVGDLRRAEAGAAEELQRALTATADRTEFLEKSMGRRRLAQSAIVQLTKEEQKALDDQAAALDKVRDSAARLVDAELRLAQRFTDSNQKAQEVIALRQQAGEADLLATQSIGRVAEAHLKERDALLEKATAIEESLQRELALQAVNQLSVEQF